MPDTFFVSLSNFHNSRWPPIACVYRNHQRMLTLFTILINLGSISRFSMVLDSLSMVPLTSNVHVTVIWQDHGHFGSKVHQNIFNIFIFIHCIIFNILISRVDLVAAYCVFKCVHGKCPMKQKLSRSQPDGARLRNIIDASIQYGDSLHVDLQEQLDANENLQMSYHRSCITWYLTHAPESETGERCSPVKRKRRSPFPLFKFREHCIYCGETCAIDKACKNPNR